MNKIITKEQFKELKLSFRKNKKKVILCHGVFDLVHPGHLIHFQQAKSLGDILVVSITAAQYVRKGPDRPYFNDEMRLNFLASIECIDYVMLSEGYTVNDIIECVEPDIYVKGQEYAKFEEDLTGKIEEEIDIVHKHGGEIHYTSGQVFSSTKLINNAFPTLSKEMKDYMKNLKQKYSMEMIRRYAEQIENKSVLVIGDVIIDEYIYCTVQGLMSKDMGYSARLHGIEKYLGGSIAVAKHVSSFTKNVTLTSIIGCEAEIYKRFKHELHDIINLDFEISESYPTIIKKRYITRNEKRDEIHKVFAVNNIPDPMIIDKCSMDKFKQKLNKLVPNYDTIILCDFGHGLIDEEIINIVQDNAKFLAVNCQTNSSNYGLNIITKYSRADAFTLDQKELQLAYPLFGLSESEKLEKLAKHLHSIGWLTKGAKGALGINKSGVHICPAFTLNVKDTIGAGDAFFAIASLFAAVNAETEVGTFMGNIAGAIAANIVGNKRSLDKIDILKYANTLFNV